MDVEAEEGFSDHFIQRESTSLSSFNVPRGQTIIHVLFDKFPFWLAAMSPLTCRCIIFIQHSSKEDLLNSSQCFEEFISHHLLNWPVDKIRYNQDMMSKPDLILASGSQEFLLKVAHSSYAAPMIFTHEFMKDAKSSHPSFSFVWHKHNVNGGCTNFQIRMGFKGLPMPPKFSSIKRALGDFIDYSTHPDHLINHNQIEENSYLFKDSYLTFHSLNRPVVLPTYKFNSGWGYRGLTRKEIFNMWGLSSLENVKLELDRIQSITPTQVAVLLLASYFTLHWPPTKLSYSKDLFLKTLPRSTSTTFPSIDVTINYDWIDDSIVLS